MRRTIKNTRKTFNKINQLSYALSQIIDENYRACRVLVYYGLGMRYCKETKTLIQTRESLPQFKKLLKKSGVELRSLQQRCVDVSDWSTYPLKMDSTFESRIKECRPVKRKTTKRKTYNSKEIQSIVDLKVQEALANLKLDNPKRLEGAK